MIKKDIIQLSENEPLRYFEFSIAIHIFETVQIKT